MIFLNKICLDAESSLSFYKSGVYFDAKCASSIKNASHAIVSTLTLNIFRLIYLYKLKRLLSVSELIQPVETIGSLEILGVKFVI